MVGLTLFALRARRNKMATTKDWFFIVYKAEGIVGKVQSVDRDEWSPSEPLTTQHFAAPHGQFCGPWDNEAEARAERGVLFDHGYEGEPEPAPGQVWKVSGDKVLLMRDLSRPPLFEGLLLEEGEDMKGTEFTLHWDCLEKYLCDCPDFGAVKARYLDSLLQEYEEGGGAKLSKWGKAVELERSMRDKIGLELKEQLEDQEMEDLLRDWALRGKPGWDVL